MELTWIQIVVAGLALVALIVIGLRRIQPGGPRFQFLPRTSSSRRMRVVERLAVSPHVSISLLSVDNHELLVLTTTASANAEVIQAKSPV